MPLPLIQCHAPCCLQVIEVPGYTLEEKVEIASRHLLPKQLDLHGLTAEQLDLPTSVLSHMVSSYTAEAGVRSLERVLGSVCRSAAVKVRGCLVPPMCMMSHLPQVASGDKVSLPIVTTLDSVDEILGVGI